MPALRVETRDGVAWVTIDHPPINLLDLALMTRSASASGASSRPTTRVRVVVFQSANPDFFIAHADVALIQRCRARCRRSRRALGFFHAMVERFRTMPKATIAQIEGCARGGGSEFVLSLDMRFGALGTCVLAQPEVALGILPGGSGTQRLPRLVGRARALEIILGCEDVDADLAERYGWMNRALPPAELGRSSTRSRTASRRSPPRRSRSPSARSTPPTRPSSTGCSRRRTAFKQSLAIPEARERMARVPRARRPDPRGRARPREAGREARRLEADPQAGRGLRGRRGRRAVIFATRTPVRNFFGALRPIGSKSAQFRNSSPSFER